MRRNTFPLVPLFALLAAIVASGIPGPAAGQAGAAVAATEAGEALVLRPRSDRGRAAVLVFTRSASGEWTQTAALEPGPGAEPYEGFGVSLAAVPGLIAAAGGDAEGIWGARVFHAGPEGEWSVAEPVPVTPLAAAQRATRPAMLDMGGLMRIMSPPVRVVALGPEGQSMALWAAGRQGGPVRVLEREAGTWRETAVLPARDSAGRGAPRLAMDRDRVVVGDPGAAPHGLVRVFVRQGGAWTLEAELRPDTAPARGFGAAVALDAGRLAVGVPGAGRVRVYELGAAGWRPTGTIPAGGGAEEAGVGEQAGDAGSGFGAAVAWGGDGLWVGAPNADGGRGAVHRYVLDPGTATWRPAQRFTPAADRAHGAPLGLGAALAVAGDVVVAGAPAADRGAGGAAVFERRDGAWRGPVWLGTGTELRPVAGRTVRCEEGQAAGFDCAGVDLLAFVDLDGLGAGPGERITDIWGWADPETGREYALVGRSAGMAIVDVTRPSAPVFVGLVRGRPAGLRDIKVFRDHAFFVGDGAGDHGLLVFDLRRVRTLGGGEPAVLEPDARYGGIGSAHNLVMDAERGLAVPVGASGGGQTCGGGLHMVDVSTPTAPVFAGCYTDDTGLIAPGRTHDAQCVVYRGPDPVYRDRRICLASNETALRIVDVTDPAAPVEVASASYPGVAYTHQGWLTDDQRYFFMNDELDELVGVTDRTRTLIWDVADLDDPILVGEHYGPDVATDHNLYIRGDRMYQANYQAGLRVVDISDPENPRDIGFFDTTPYGPNHAGFGGGAWTAYPFLPSGVVLVSSIHEGLFVLRPRPAPVP